MPGFIHLDARCIRGEGVAEIGPEIESKAAVLDKLKTVHADRVRNHAGIGNCLHVGGHS